MRAAALLAALAPAAMLAGCAASAPPRPLGAETAPAATTPAEAEQDAVGQERLRRFQYLYGSGEAAALSIATFQALVGHARAQVASRPAEGVVLTAESTLDAPSFVGCGDKPLAAVFDVDETLILNLGYEYREAATGRGFDAVSWRRWEETGGARVAAVPGAVAALNALRRMGVTVVFNSNRSAANAAQTAEALRRAGLGEAVHGETLFLSGDDAMGGRKDGRRAAIAERYCVITMAGDQLGDFTDLFNQEGMTAKGRRSEVSSGWATKLWGAGWFLLPNPVYGAALQGGLDDLFPTDKRWDDPAEEKANALDPR